MTIRAILEKAITYLPAEKNIDLRKHIEAIYQRVVGLEGTVSKSVTSIADVITSLEKRVSELERRLNETKADDVKRRIRS